MTSRSRLDLRPCRLLRLRPERPGCSEEEGVLDLLRLDVCLAVALVALQPLALHDLVRGVL